MITLFQQNPRPSASYPPSRCRKGGWRCGPSCSDRQYRELLVPAFLRGGTSPLARLAKEIMLR